MLIRVLSVIAILFLCSICFFPLLRFVAPRLTDTSLSFFLFMSLIHSVFMMGVVWFLNKSAGKDQPFGNRNAFGLLFLSGVFFVIAFGMGAPPRDASAWIANGMHEVWRAVFLELAVLCTAIGLYLFSRLIRIHLSRLLGIVFLVLAAVGIALIVYDFYWGLFIIPRDIDSWAKEGKDLSQFFNQYDMRNGIRGSARCFVYLASILTFLAGWKLRMIRTWVAIVLSLLCVFLLQDILIPLLTDVSTVGTHVGMVPAVVLSPLYLLGVYWLAEYKTEFNSESL